MMLTIVALFLCGDAVRSRPAPATRSSVVPGVRFEANVGQFDPPVRYVGRAGELTVALLPDAMVLRLAGCPDAVTLRVEASSSVEPQASEPLAAWSHYLRGRDPAGWHLDVPGFGVVRYPDILRGVDLLWHGQDGAFEYDLVVAPSARVEDVVVDVVGGAPSIRSDDALSIRTSRGDIVSPRPTGYQLNDDGSKQTVAVRYRLFDERGVGFDVAPFDATRALVIDPVLTFSTLLGGISADSAQGVAVDASGNLYVAGSSPAGFPTGTSAYQPDCAGDMDVFVAKLAADGRSLLYATYVGGSGDDVATSIAVDASGNAYVAGQTLSPDFPVANAVEPSPSGVQAGFTFMLDAHGSSLVFSTYLGGSDSDTATAIAVDAAGSAYVTGQTVASDFPLANPLQSLIAGATDAFVTKFQPGGASLAYSTFLGGLHDDAGGGIAVDADGEAYVTGGTFSLDFPEAGPIPSSGSGGAFLVELNPAGSSFVYAVTLGSLFDQGQAVAVDSSGNAYMGGLSVSGEYPLLNPLPGAAALTGTNAFVTKILSDGEALSYSTVLGGASYDSVTGIAVDTGGHATVAGYTYSLDFPTTAPIQANPITTLNGIAAFVSEIGPDDSAFVFSTYLGGSSASFGYAVALGSSGEIFVAGATGDLNFPTQNALQPAFPSATSGSQAFVAEISPGDSPLLVVTPSPSSVVPLGTTKFRASGGSGSGYAFSLYSNASGGSIDTVTGAYTAGPAGGVLDVVLVTDSSGTTASSAVVVAAIADGGLDAGKDAPNADARSLDSSEADAPTREADAPGTAQGDGEPVPPPFEASGSECAIRAQDKHLKTFDIAFSALLAVAAIRRRQRGWNPSRLES
jgi:hypothetical protein